MACPVEQLIILPLVSFKKEEQHEHNKPNPNSLYP